LKHSWTLTDDLQQFDLGDSDVYVGEWQGFEALNMNKVGAAVFLRDDIQLSSFRLQAFVAIPEEVGFIGLIFGARDSSNYELIYLSPGNAEGTGEIQYDPVMNGSTTWQIYNGPNYLTHTPYIAGEWVQFTIDVHQHSATVYVGPTLVPQLVIKNLQHGSVEGRIGFWGYLPGYIRDLSIEELPSPLPANEERAQSNDEGFVTDWLVSDPYLTGLHINENNWTKAVVEENGTLNINRLYVSTKDLSVQVKSSVTVLEDIQAIVSFGFSDELRLWINEQEVYHGIWMWNPPDHDGRIRPDHVSIPITWKAGKNEIRAEITSRETIFGWGLCLKWT
jgi:hypothetical protein